MGGLLEEHRAYARVLEKLDGTLAHPPASDQFRGEGLLGNPRTREGRGAAVPEKITNVAVRLHYWLLTG